MKTKEKAIGLAIVEDTSDIREVLVAYFSRQEDIQLIYAASDAEDLFQHADFTQINLVICDIGLPHINGGGSLLVDQTAIPQCGGDDVHGF